MIPYEELCAALDRHNNVEPKSAPQDEGLVQVETGEVVEESALLEVATAEEVVEEAALLEVATAEEVVEEAALLEVATAEEDVEEAYDVAEATPLMSDPEPEAFEPEPAAQPEVVVEPEAHTDAAEELVVSSAGEDAAAATGEIGGPITDEADLPPVNEQAIVVEPLAQERYDGTDEVSLTDLEVVDGEEQDR